MLVFYITHVIHTILQVFLHIHMQPSLSAKQETATNLLVFMDMKSLPVYSCHGFHKFISGLKLEFGPKWAPLVTMVTSTTEL